MQELKVNNKIGKRFRKDKLVDEIYNDRHKEDNIVDIDTNKPKNFTTVEWNRYKEIMKQKLLEEFFNKDFDKSVREKILEKIYLEYHEKDLIKEEIKERKREISKLSKEMYMSQDEIISHLIFDD